MARLPNYSYSDLEAEHYAKMKEKDLREQANKTALPEDIEIVNPYHEKSIDTAGDASKEASIIVKTIAITMLVFGIFIGAFTWLG